MTPMTWTPPLIQMVYTICGSNLHTHGAWENIAVSEKPTLWRATQSQPLSIIHSFAATSYYMALSQALGTAVAMAF